MYSGLANSYLSAGKPGEAIAPARRAVELNPLFLSGWIALGHAYDSVRRYFEAGTCLEKVLAIDSTNVAALNNLAVIYLREDRPEKALDLLRRAAVRGDTLPGTWWANIAQVCTDYLGDYRGGRTAAESGIQKIRMKLERGCRAAIETRIGEIDSKVGLAV